MRIGVLGINYKSADLEYREALAKACYKRLHAESSMAHRLFCVLLLTCHRVEVYFCAEDLAAAHSSILHVLREEIPFAFEHKLYAYFGSDCFAHLAQVAAGLDSMVLAESEIQRQVKQTYEQTCLDYNLPGEMHYLFQKSLRLGKHLRSQFAFSSGQMTIPKMIYEIVSHALQDWKEESILFIGNSEINRKVLSYFKNKGAARFTLCTRSLLSARDLLSGQELELCDWSHLSHWEKYPIVISGTYASRFLIRTAQESGRTRFIFDLGVPRNIDPVLARHPRFALLNIDELGGMMHRREEKQMALQKEMESIIACKVDYYVAAFREKRMRLCSHAI